MFTDRVIRSLDDKAYKQVRRLVRIQVDEQIRDQITNQVWQPVFVQVWHTIANRIEENIFYFGGKK